MAIEKSLVSGSMTMLILKLLSEKDMYGYEMIDTLRQKSQNVFELKAGTLYPLLHSLEDKGFLTVYEQEAAGKTRKYYSLTRQGRGFLEKKVEEWKEYSAAVTAASAIIGPIIPPSNIMIIYAVCASNVSVSAMFLGGILPGIVLGLAEMLLCYYFARKYNHPCRERRSTRREILHSLKRSLPALGLPIIILGGIVSGVFTATESSAVAVFYALIVAVCKRQITLKSLKECCVNTAKTTANVMLIISIASAMSYAITVLRIPQAMVEVCMKYVNSPAVFLLLVNLILLILGCVLDQSPALLMMTPILLPIAMKYGIDPVHFGVLCCFNLTVGLISPPIGMTLFVTANVAKVKLTDLFKQIIPFVLVGLAVLMLITWVPALTTFIPNLFS